MSVGVSDFRLIFECITTFALIFGISCPEPSTYVAYLSDLLPAKFLALSIELGWLGSWWKVCAIWVFSLSSLRRGRLPTELEAFGRVSWNEIKETEAFILIIEFYFTNCN